MQILDKSLKRLGVDHIDLYYAHSDVRLKVLDEVATEAGATRNQVVYHWLMNGSPSAIPLVASTTDAQFEEALGSLHISLSDEQMKRLTEARA